MFWGLEYLGAPLDRLQSYVEALNFDLCAVVERRGDSDTGRRYLVSVYENGRRVTDLGEFLSRADANGVAERIDNGIEYAKREIARNIRASYRLDGETITHAKSSVQYGTQIAVGSPAQIRAVRGRPTISINKRHVPVERVRELLLGT